MCVVALAKSRSDGHSPEVRARAGGSPPVARTGQRAGLAKRTITALVWTRLTEMGVRPSKSKVLCVVEIGAADDGKIRRVARKERTKNVERARDRGNHEP